MQVIETGSVAAGSFAITRALRASPLQVRPHFTLSSLIALSTQTKSLSAAMTNLPGEDLVVLPLALYTVLRQNPCLALQLCTGQGRMWDVIAFLLSNVRKKH